MRKNDACVIRAHGTSGESATRHTIDPALVEIRPEPSPAERAAILIALEQMLDAARTDAPAPSAWSLAGRRESLSGSMGGSRPGWERGLDRLNGW